MWVPTALLWQFKKTLPLFLVLRLLLNVGPQWGPPAAPGQRVCEVRWWGCWPAAGGSHGRTGGEGRGRQELHAAVRPGTLLCTKVSQQPIKQILYCKRNKSYLCKTNTRRIKFSLQELKKSEVHFWWKLWCSFSRNFVQTDAVEIRQRSCLSFAFLNSSNLPMKNNCFSKRQKQPRHTTLMLLRRCREHNVRRKKRSNSPSFCAEFASCKSVSNPDPEP